MKRRRTFALLLAFIAVSTIVVSPGAFSAVTADRTVSVDVVSDEAAYLGLQRSDPVQLPAGETSGQELIHLTNQFPVPLTQITASVVEADEGDDPSILSVDVPSSLAPGESGSITADVDCGSDGNEETVTVEIEAIGEDESSVQLEREVTIECQEPPPPEIQEYDFKGCSEVWVVIASEPMASFDVTFRIYDAEADDRRDVDVTVNPAELTTIKGQHGDAPLYKFNVHDHIGRSGDANDKLLGARTGGSEFTENGHQCANNLSTD